MNTQTFFWLLLAVTTGAMWALVALVFGASLTVALGVFLIGALLTFLAGAICCASGRDER